MIDSIEMEKLRFPIGKFNFKYNTSENQIENDIKSIEDLPQKLRNEVENLTEEQLNIQYRPDGWTIKQVVHHLADSHINSYVRFKLTMTEDKPIIKTYMEERWAELPDAKDAPIEMSLDLLDALHLRWVTFLNSLTFYDFNRTFIHPELGEVSLDKIVGLYAWHGKHHLAHITSLKKRMNW